MQVSKVQSVNTNVLKINPQRRVFEHKSAEMQPQKLSGIPYNYYTSSVSFRERVDRFCSVKDIDLDYYRHMSEAQKKYYRLRCKHFVDKIDKNQLFDPEHPDLPLKTKANMDAFIETSRIYNQYREHPIICVGRSPKWFLNASLWMKDGIEDYKFVAFSGYWYQQEYDEIVRKDIRAPKPDEIRAYRKYLTSIEADPRSIIKKVEEKGRKAIITDYITTGKGVTSLLEIMSDLAEDQKVLDKFANSIQLVGIGSMEYLEYLDPYRETYSIPDIALPEKLQPYWKQLQTTYYDMPFDMFWEMLRNQNTNECRSTYYPHFAWTQYRPDRFKVGLIKDYKKVENLIKRSSKKCVTSFQPAMKDYRNLLNFRILDELFKRGLLTTRHLHTR